MKHFLTIFLVVHACLVNAQTKIFPGEKPPSDTPQIFAPGIISDQFGNRDMAISPDGDELFYTLQYARGLISTILYSQKVDGKWTSPEVAPFSGMYNDLEPAFSADGATLYFVSNRPVQPTGKKKDYDIWYVAKANGKWKQPVNAVKVINSDKDEFYPSIAKNGNIYFTRAVDGREEDILVSLLVNGKYTEAKGLNDSVNSNFDEFNAFVDPDESFIIFSSFGRKDDMGNGDLYISNYVNGSWANAVHLPSPVNTPSLDYCPYISPDKKYFFFTSNRHIIKIPFPQQQTLSSLKSLLQDPLNGYDNIYWMNADVLFKK